MLVLANRTDVEVGTVESGASGAAQAARPTTGRVPVTNALRTREEILAALAAFPDELARIIFKDHDPDALTRPASDGGWGVVEILPHLRDWEEIYLERAHRIVEEDHPHLPGYDDELWSIERDYRGQDPDETMEDFRRLRDEHVEFLRALPPEAWARPGTHGYYGEITLQWMENHVCDHDQEHLQQARDALAG
ncbi:MAG: hypothetical protein QOF33_1511 [Thermomicrobiales bacterium]|jgi:hypothetical protein|nr:hypothetical protein [Thermomicrobiales bacterium]MEA2530227.1 hypothetical protein [Thermomicrobiales bacterium]MEA2583426.1 hypothetical protein [Thermomicrobiales bacterium]